MIYFGKIGRMVGVKCASAQQVTNDDPVSFATTLEGRVTAQRRLFSRRKWSLSTADGTAPSEHAPLMDFTSGAWGPGPFVFVPADAPVTNMLTPGASSCDPAAGMRTTDSPDGPMLTPDGWAPRSIRAGAAADEMWFGEAHVPVLDREQITVSAYVLGAGAAVRVFWYDANGGGLGGNTSTVTATAGTTVRSWMTLTPPQNAVSLRVRARNATRGARPAVTRGPVLHPWATGRGCDKAVIHEMDTQTVMAARSAQFESVSYTVTEVG